MSRIHKTTSPGKVRQPIATLDDWKTLARPKSERQWVSGRSAMETAIAWLEDGGESLPREVAAALEANPDFGPVLSWHAEPEVKLHFDDFAGEPRNSDLVVYAEDRHGPYLIAVEAKADESFGETFIDTLGSAVERCISNSRSKGGIRALQLATAIFGPRQTGEVKVGRMRYQLMTACAGALCDAERHGMARALVLIQEFVTDKTVDDKHRKNDADLRAFVGRLSHGEVSGPSAGEICGPFLVPGQPIIATPIKLYIGKVTRNIRRKAP